MSLIIRVASADNTKVFTRRLEGASTKVEVPEGAVVAVINEATGEVIPVTARLVVNEAGERELLFVFDVDGEEMQFAVLETAAWPADAMVATNEGLDVPEALAKADLVPAEELAREGSPFALGEGVGGMGVLGFVIAGLVVAGAAIAISGDDDIDLPPSPQPQPDTIAPAAPAGLDLADASDPDGDNAVPSGEGLVFTGTAEVGSQVRLFVNGTQVAVRAVSNDGTWSITTDLPEGTSSITATATDAAGNVSPVSTALEVTVDATAPAAPVNLNLIASDDNGASSDDNVVSGGEGLTITGNAEAGSTIEIFVNGVSVGTTTTAAGVSNFSFDVDLAEGVSEITATATDAQGNVSEVSAPLAITVDNTAPDAPVALDLDAADDDGDDDDDNLTDQLQNLTITGQAEAGSTVSVFVNGVGTASTTVDADGNFSVDLTLAAGERVITATATDQFGQTSEISEGLTITVGQGPVLLNTSIDGEGQNVTLYFSEALAGDLPQFSQFSITDAEGNVLANVIGVEANGTRGTLYLDQPISAEDGPLISYTSVAGRVTDAAGNAAAGFTGVAITNDTSFEPSGLIGVGKQGKIDLDGAEIVAYDPGSERFFVTSGDGLQVISVDSALNLTLLGTIDLGSNTITSVAVKNGVVAVAVVADTKTDNGSVFLLDAAGEVGPGMVLNEVEVGALPDMVTFTPDGLTILVANEGERTTLDDVEDGAELVDPEGSVSLVDISGGVENASVRTAGFAGFNDQAAELAAAGVRLFAGLAAGGGITVAQDLEPEYIAVSPDGTQALITLQEANAVAVLDIATATIIDIQPLGLKPFNGLPFDFSDRDDGYNPRTDNANVYGQFMPDSISSFVGGDGKTYYVIANEGDARDDFFEDVDGRVDDLDLDPTAFPNADDLQDNEALGRLEVTVVPGIDGDTDGDGDIDEILSYGGRSFSILDENGVIIYDSGSVIEQLAASLGEFDFDDIPDTGVYDDGRADAKGPEPEAITTGVYGDRVLAFVGLERGGGGVAVFDVTNPADVELITYLREASTLAPEGLVYIPAEDSPTGKPVLAVASEGDDIGMALTTFELAPEGVYTLQLLHFADAEAKTLALDTAPNLAALVDAFEDGYGNSITLAGGDNFIPGLFFDAQADDSIVNAFGFGGGPKLDIAIHNAIGVQASTIGNHEFDKGTENFASAIAASGAYDGALFPYLSANLDFAGDANLAGFFQQTLGAGLEDAADLANTIVPSAVIEEGGELIGVVGATTQVLQSLTSLGGVDVIGGDENDMELLAAQLQPYIDDLIAQGVNKIIVMSHLQQIALEQELAPLLEGVDIILAAGSNTRLADDNDELVAFNGHPAVSQGDYPIVTAGSDGKPTLIVNTDNEFTYLGRLVVDFDSDGVIILDNLDDTVNGAYAATAENVAAAWGVGESDNFAVNTLGGSLSQEAFDIAVTGGAYVNVLTTANAGGELRGQLVLVQDNRAIDGNGTVVFEVALSGDSEVPAVETDAFGGGRIIVLARDGAYSYNSEFAVFDMAADAVTGFGIFDDTSDDVLEDIGGDEGTEIELVPFNFLDNAFAEGTRGGEVLEYVTAVDAVVDVQLTNVFGYSNFYLEGNRVPGVRTEETNLGNLTADANAYAAREALGFDLDDVVVSYKNGGGIRASIGQPLAVGNDVLFIPNDLGVITERDINSVLAFNNGLVVFDTTPQGLLNILNSPNVFENANGGFGQISGLQVSYDPDAPQGDRVVDIALVDGNGNKTALVDDGEVVDGAPASFKMVTLDFIAANDGDGTQIAENGSNFRYIVDNGDGSYSLSEVLPIVAGGVAPGTVVVDTGVFGGDKLGEQSALADFLADNFGTPDTAFDMEDTTQEFDERIQNTDAREDTVLDNIEAPAAALILDESFA